MQTYVLNYETPMRRVSHIPGHAMAPEGPCQVWPPFRQGICRCIKFARFVGVGLRQGGRRANVIAGQYAGKYDGYDTLACCTHGLKRYVCVKLQRK